MKNTNSPNNHEIGFIRLEEILKLIPVSKSTWWNGCSSGRFPKPYKIGPRTTAWRKKDILDFIDGLENE